jgi:hypothetical protein
MPPTCISHFYTTIHSNIHSLFTTTLSSTHTSTITIITTITTLLQTTHSFKNASLFPSHPNPNPRHRAPHHHRIRPSHRSHHPKRKNRVIHLQYQTSQSLPVTNTPPPQSDISNPNDHSPLAQSQSTNALVKRLDRIAVDKGNVVQVSQVQGTTGDRRGFRWWR